MDIVDYISRLQSSAIKTGLDETDRLIKFSLYNLVVVAAQKKIGKSRWLTRIAYNIAMNSQLPVKVFSLENMKYEQEIMFISTMTRTSRDIILERDVNDALVAAELRKQVGIVSALGIDIQDHSNNIIQDIQTWINKNQMGVIIIDNFGYVNFGNNNNELQREEEFMKALTEIKKQYPVLIILVHHMNKENSKSVNKTEEYRPRVSDIRGNARFSDFADQVILLHRPAAYPDIRQLYNEKGKLTELNYFYAYLDLNRFGETGEVCYEHYDLSTCEFIENVL